MEYTEFQNVKISFTDSKTGKAIIVLLHGYLETKEIWGEFATRLSEKFRVINIDLPGHGESDLPQQKNTMEFMAGAVNKVLEKIDIDKCIMLGHSMGGYALMAFLENYPEKLSGFSLFHSAPFADSEEKKQNRNREIELVKKGKKEQIYKTHFPKVFSNTNQQKFAPQIQRAIDNALKMKPDAIIATLEGMKARKDRTEVLKNTNIPFLYFLGLHDNFIPPSILDKLQMPEKSTIVKLNNSGHIGFIEQCNESVAAVEKFITKIKQ